MVLINWGNLQSCFIFFPWPFEHFQGNHEVLFQLIFPVWNQLWFRQNITFLLWKQLIWYSVTFQTFKKELLDNYGCFLYPLSYTEISLLQFLIYQEKCPTLMMHFVCLLLCLINFIYSLTTKFGTFVATLRKFSFKMVCHHFYFIFW